MIAFYSHTFSALAGMFWRVRFWVHEHPRWSKVIAVILIDVFLVMFGNTYWAFAADGGGAAPFMLGGNITDSSGVPLSYYTVLPLDRGDIFNWNKAFIAAWLDPIWTELFLSCRASGTISPLASGRPDRCPVFSRKTRS